MKPKAPLPHPTVLQGSTAQEVASVPAKSDGRTQGAVWELKARDELKATLRHLQKTIASLIAKDANEADTRMVVTDVLRDGLGYREYGDLATEYQIKGEYADYGIRIDHQLVAFVEVKRATTKLGPKHLRQVEMYAVNEGVEWLILTNASDWEVYHLSAGMPVVIDLAFRINLLDTAVPLGERLQKLFYLHHDSLKRRQIDELWHLQAATSPKRIAEALLAPEALNSLRREIWKLGRERVDVPELARLLRETVIRPDCLL